MSKKHMVEPAILLLLLLMLLAFTMTGCGGGSGGDSSGSIPITPGTPSLQVLPASFDFGIVTTNNSPAPLEVIIMNNGTAALQISNIALSDQSNFSLNPNGGSKPCSSNSPTIPAADTCSFNVGFQPTTDGTFSSNVQISSNDGSFPVFTITINGSADPVRTIAVRINQLETFCPTNEVKAYVSITDQGGYPLTGLTDNDFSVIEDSTALLIRNAIFVDTVYEQISIAAVMDYSGSLSPQEIEDMQYGFIYLFNNLKTTDFAEIIKFASEFEVVQPWTSDKDALVAAVSAPFQRGWTRLYDSIFQAVSDTALRNNFRRAVIVVTDGEESPDPNGSPSIHGLDDVINNATSNGVPVFTIGIGNSINRAILTQIADETGGQFFAAQTSQNLATIYQQLTSILYENQYILTFEQLPIGTGFTGNLNIEANSSSIRGDDTVIITSCN